MNLRIFPVHSNPSRRLRRVSGFSAFDLAGDRRSQPNFRHAQQTLNDTWHLTMASPQQQAVELLSQPDREMQLRQQALDNAQQGDLPTAIALFTQLIHYNPNSASNFNNRGLLHFQTGQWQQALMDYDRALMLNPRLGKVYNNRGNCYAAIGNFNAAIADYERAIDLDPTDMRARLNLGITLRQLGCFSEAIEQFDLALQLSQFLTMTATVSIAAEVDGHLHAERGRTYHLSGDWNCAVADYHRALQYLPIANPNLHPAQRSRCQVKGWLRELLSPLQTT